MLDRKGTAYIRTCVLVLVICMVLSAMLFYTTALTSASAAKKNVKRILDGYVMRNSVEIYSSIKQGNDYLENTDSGYFVSLITDELDLKTEGRYLVYRDPDSSEIIRMSRPQVSFTRQNSLDIEASFDVYMPVRFAGTELFTLTVPVTVRSGMKLKTGD